jgi:hypothetical protein
MMIDSAYKLLKEQGTSAAVAYLSSGESTTAVAEAYNEIIKKLYWIDKDIPRVVTMSHAGIEYCMDPSRLADLPDEAARTELRSLGKQLAYNLASFTWPGWNEADLDIAPQYMADGLDAARLNLRLALELNKGDLPVSRAYWMLGAQLMARGAQEGAAANFRRAQLYASRANAMADEMINGTYALLAAWLTRLDCRECARDYQKAWKRLGDLKDGESYQIQLNNARSVFLG